MSIITSGETKELVLLAHIFFSNESGGRQDDFSALRARYIKTVAFDGNALIAPRRGRRRLNAD